MSKYVCTKLYGLVKTEANERNEQYSALASLTCYRPVHGCHLHR